MRSVFFEGRFDEIHDAHERGEYGKYRILGCVVLRGPKYKKPMCRILQLKKSRLFVIVCFTPTLESRCRNKIGRPLQSFQLQNCSDRPVSCVEKTLGKRDKLKFVTPLLTLLSSGQLTSDFWLYDLGLLFGQQHLAHLPHFAGLQNRKIHAARQFSRIEGDVINPAFLAAID